MSAYNETAIVKRSKLRLKIGNVYIYQADLLIKKNVTFVLRYPITKRLRNLKRVTNTLFYGRDI